MYEGKTDIERQKGLFKNWAHQIMDTSSKGVGKIFKLEVFFFLIFSLYTFQTLSRMFPYTLPLPCSPTHPLPLLGPGIPLYWGI
jgi:hypothetical protein